MGGREEEKKAEKVKERERERKRGSERASEEERTLPKAQSSVFFLRIPPRERVRDRVLLGGGRKWSTANCWRV